MLKLHERRPHCGHHFEHARCDMAFSQGESDMENFEPGSGGQIMSLLHHALRRMARARHERGHAQHAQLRVLSIIAGQASMSMSQRDLLEELDIRSSSLSELLAKLERSGLVERERDEADRRNFIVKITDEGRNLLKGHANERQHGVEGFFASFTQEEREQFVALLQKLNDSLEKLYPASGDFEEPTGRGRGFHRHGHPHMEREGHRFGRHQRRDPR